MKVRLKLSVKWYLPSTSMRFNSMKVRLKHWRVNYIRFLCSMFQFHEGPIKTLSKLALISSAASFQFHEGPIKTLIKT